jgi:thymidylate synthase (FAD)
MTLLSRLRRLDEVPEADRNPSWHSERDGLQNLLGEKESGRLVERLDDGFVRLVDSMGTDAAIVQAARVSYGAGTKAVSDDRGLIRYLIRHYHTTPLEMVEFKFHVRVPMDCWRQWIRHRMASTNEYSTRYSEAIDSCQTTAPDEWRSQAKNNKQGSAGAISDQWPEGYRIEPPNDGNDSFQGVVLDPKNRPRMMVSIIDGYTPARYLSAIEHHAQDCLRDIYEERLKFGVAREQARKDLPLSTYTEAYWKIDLHNLFHFLRLRMDSHAQAEIRMYANAIGQLIKPIVPLAWDAFEDYRLNSITLSGPEIDAIRRLLDRSPIHGGKELSKRERDELQSKLDSLALAL